MPNKHNVNGRHHISKVKFTVRDWCEYDAAFRACGSSTLWVTPEAIDSWLALARTKCGQAMQLSNLAIETSLMLRLV